MPEQDTFTAIVYFHGIGQQSRYEELSRVIESLDDYAVVHEDNHLQRIHAKVEPSRSEISNENVGYVTLNRDGKEYRFYEVYWAPLTTNGTTAWSVFTWFIRHIITPINIVNSTWSSRRRWRMSYLYSLWDDTHKDSQEFTPLMRLIQIYNDFCDNALRGTNLKGSFEEFVDYVSQQPNETKVDLVELSQRWRGYMFRKEFWNFFVFLTLAYLTVLVPILIISRTIQFWLSGKTLADLAQIDTLTLIFYGIVSVMVFVIPSVLGRFLRDYGGDVQLWSTYEETDDKYRKRQAIVRLGLDTMTHVLNHDGCERVIMMGHSLGAPIAYDTLLAIGRHNRALEQAKIEGVSPEVYSQTADATLAESLSEDLDKSNRTPLPMTLSKRGRSIQTSKIEYFITMASPIDKIYYLFESKRGLYRPYELIVDEIRGDIGVTPFVLPDEIPNFRWINFWSQEDYVGGASFTPNPRNFKKREMKVSNVLIQTHYFPSPARSHVGYFRHNAVIGTLYNLIFERDNPETSRELQALLTSKSSLRSQRVRNIMLILSWTLLFAIVCDVFGFTVIHQFFTVIFLSLLTFGIIITIASFLRGALHSFEKDGAGSR